MKTGKGLIELLLRLGITPTGDRVKDIELDRVGMLKPFIKTNSKE
jgi:hypothetical protein